MRNNRPCEKPDGQLRSSAYTLARSFAAVAIACSLAACSPKTSTIQIVDLGVNGSAAGFEETFEEAYFDVDALGHLDIILRRTEPSPTAKNQNLTQIVHVHSIWRSIPGQTVADGTQINSCVTYALLDGDLGSSIDGTGALFLEGMATGDELSGSLEHAMLKPKRQLAAHHTLFERADLNGSFHAQRNRQRTRQLINDLHRRFGPVVQGDP